MTFLINAGTIDPRSWVMDDSSGGGRIIGEVCHFIDLMMFLCGESLESVFAAGAQGPKAESATQGVSVTLAFSRGSVGTINYWANGPKSLPKEEIKAFRGGGAVVVSNFRTTTMFDGSKKERFATIRQDKGHRAEIRSFLEAARGKAALDVSIETFIDSSLATFAIGESLRNGSSQRLDAWRGKLAELVAAQP
jgi:polar amino acid transport system substrate-binding protein